MFSQRFWEVVLIKHDSLEMAEREWAGALLIAPVAPFGYASVWRHVGNSHNRRWGIYRDATARVTVPIARVGIPEEL